MVVVVLGGQMMCWKEKLCSKRRAGAEILETAAKLFPQNLLIFTGNEFRATGCHPAPETVPSLSPCLPAFCFSYRLPFKEVLFMHLLSFDASPKN